MTTSEVSPAGSPEKAGDKNERQVSLQYRHIFGLKANVKGTVHFAEESQVLYPAGHNTILYATDQKTQLKFFNGSEGSEGITCLALSPNRKFLAVCERFMDKAICSVFDVLTGKKRRGTLSFQDCDAKEFVYAAFSADNKFLITQGGPPDFTLVLWSWDKARPHGSVKVSNITGSTIHECSFNPQDPSRVCVVGDGVFKFFVLQDNTFKTQPNQIGKLREGHNQNYVCHAWVHNQDRLIVCTESGEALLFDNGGEYKMVLPHSPFEMGSLRCIAACNKGFVTGGDGGIIRIYEHSDDVKEIYKKAREIKVDAQNGGSVTSLAVSPSEEVLAIATSSSQLLQVSLSSSDIMKSEESPSDFISTSFHSGPIYGLDVCVRKPLVVTCGVDKSVRVWNYLDKT
jgi:WD40 repeat protein